jgi:hypothetical protein
MNEVYNKIKKNGQESTNCCHPFSKTCTKKESLQRTDTQADRWTDRETVITAEKARRNNLAIAHILFQDYK